MQQIRFISENKNGALFFAALRQRVDSHFKENKIQKQCNRKMVIKTVVLLSAYLLPFAAILTGSLMPSATLFLWVLMGLALAGIGMSVMHDANHGAYSRSHKTNYWLGHTLNLLGASVFNWKLQHNLLHHTYTNVVHLDDDIDDKLVMRFSPHTRAKWYQQFQFLYAFLFYGILTLYWVAFKDFVQFYKYSAEGVNSGCKRSNRRVLFKIIVCKLLYFFVFLAYPLALLKLPAGPYLGGFFIMHFVAGIVLTVIFQLAHTVEGTSHPLPNELGDIENNWAVHQLNTTVNFSQNNKWLSWYIGGLNFQIEHHLFPHICHVHYPAIAPIVKQTANEYGIPYLENETFWKALRAHIGALKTLGRLPLASEAIS